MTRVVAGFFVGCGLVYFYHWLFLQPTDFAFFTAGYFRDALLEPVVGGGIIGAIAGLLLQVVRICLGRRPSQQAIVQADDGTVWPPPPSGQPPLNKPSYQFLSIWECFLITAGSGVLFSGLWAWLAWHNHRTIHWWEAAFQGFWLFFINFSLQVGIRHWRKRKNNNIT